jgi:hypothetical protein
MNTQKKLRNNLIRKIHKLSTGKLTELTKLLSKIENQFNSKESTLKLAGKWKDLDHDLYIDLTENLHSHRAIDRQIN